jgi:hypothetical protein
VRVLSRYNTGNLDLVGGTGARKKKKRSSAVRSEKITAHSGYL